MSRLHNSAKPLRLDALREMEQQNDHFGGCKPRGLWYGIGDAWLQWCESEMPGWVKPHTANIILRRGAKILRLKFACDILDFTEQYGLEGRLPGIAWERVATEYDGIEIAPYQWSCRLAPETFWYYGWDCASGCIWRPRAIAAVHEVVRPEMLVAASPDPREG